MMEKELVRILHVVHRMEAAGLQSFIMNIYRTIGRSQELMDAGYDVNKVSAELIELYKNMIRGYSHNLIYLFVLPSYDSAKSCEEVVA